MKTLIIGLIITSISLNSNAMRCDGKIVDTGDTANNVLTSCGEPTTRSQDFWGDKGVMTYQKSDGSTWTVETLNGNVSNIDMGR